MSFFKAGTPVKIVKTLNFGEGRPIILHSSVDVPSNSDIEAPAGSLINASGEAIEVHSFKFSLRPSNKTLQELDISPAMALVSGGQVGVALSVKDPSDNGYSLTRGQVPIWSFGPAHGIGDEFSFQSLGSGLGETIFSTTATYQWKLDHPLFIPPGARIVPVFRSIGSFNFEITAGVTAVGRTVPHSGKQSTYKVPWVATYLSSSYQYNDVGNEESSPKALQNPTNKPVTIERFIGRLYNVTTNLIDANVRGIQDVTQLVSTLSGSADSWFARCFSLQMADSMGNPLVRVSTLFRNVFEPAVRSWEVRHLLPPEQFFRVKLFKNNGQEVTADVTNTGPINRSQVSITMVGWREVSWQKAA